MHGREFCDIKAVGQNSVWLALQEMFGFVGSDMGDSCEDIARVGSCSFNTVSVIDTTFSSFRIHIKVLQVVVEIDRAGAKISTKKSGVSCENSRNIDSSLFAQRESYSG